MSRPATALPLIRPRRWREGDTLGPFNRSGAIRERGPFEQTHETLATLGFKVQEAPHARGRYGHMAGTPAQRASDIHTDVHDPIDRVDRMLFRLLLGGASAGVAAVVPCGFTDCKPSDGSFGTPTLDEIFDDDFGPLCVPVFRGAPLGHVEHQITLPLGVPAEMGTGTLRLLEPAVC